MPPNHLLKEKTPPQPENHQIFDPWSSVSTGHQRADGPTLSHTTAWRDTRTEKLARQFVLGDCNADDRGRGEWRMMKKDEGRVKEGRDIRGFMGGVQKRKRMEMQGEIAGKSMCLQGDTLTSAHMPASTTTLTSMPTSTHANRDLAGTNAPPDTDTDTATATDADANANANANANAATPAPASTPASKTRTPSKKILAGTTIYLNGSTMPLISDHKLKHLLVSHGAKLALVLSSSVTHVIIGKPNTNTPGAGKGAGGGLAAGKLQREVERCGRKVKVVGVEWALESIKGERRLSETKFASRLGRQPSVFGML